MNSTMAVKCTTYQCTNYSNCTHRLRRLTICFSPPSSQNFRVKRQKQPLSWTFFETTTRTYLGDKGGNLFIKILAEQVARVNPFWILTSGHNWIISCATSAEPPDGKLIVIPTCYHCSIVLLIVF